MAQLKAEQLIKAEFAPSGKRPLLENQKELIHFKSLEPSWSSVIYSLFLIRKE